MVHHLLFNYRCAALFINIVIQLLNCTIGFVIFGQNLQQIPILHPTIQTSQQCTLLSIFVNNYLVAKIKKNSRWTSKTFVGNVKTFATIYDRFGCSSRQGNILHKEDN
ncbi:hypothetical protein LOAG_13331 [Loa loa]|uniref:Uncharacterized protein n=1 Tax=Loa loa TaxID=7209 RepID=A0A1S0TJP8_LOALO|nr:hypothetical protein LOAG_13331 [Loa loa]EFO15183.1 hypothetical protein LOAG_13331 [Loa loa]